MCWAIPFLCIIEDDCGKLISISDVFLPYYWRGDNVWKWYMSDVFLPYYWGGDNVWKVLLLSHKRRQAIFTYFSKPLCWNIIDLGL